MSGNVQRCADVIDRLTAALRNGDDISAEDLRHVATCPDCKRVLAAAVQLEDEFEAARPADRDDERLARVTREAESVLRARRWRRVAFTTLGTFAALIPWLMLPKGLPADVARTYLILQVLGALVGLGAVGSLVVDGLNAKSGSVKLYKRLRQQWLFGVCRGMAEASGLSVWVLRAVFILLLFCGKIGWAIAVPLYLLLDMSLQVHPEDRRLLLRFKFKRWRENRVMHG